MSKENWEQIGRDNQAAADFTRSEVRQAQTLTEAIDMEARKLQQPILEKVLVRAKSIRAEAIGIASSYNRSLSDANLKMHIMPTSNTNFTIQRGNSPIRAAFLFKGVDQLEVLLSDSYRDMAGGTEVYLISDGPELIFKRNNQEVHPAQIVNDACKWVISAQAPF